MNNLKTFLLMLVMTLILIGIGNILGGTQGMVIAFVLAAVMNFASYWFSDRIVLSMYRAKKIEEQDMPELYSTVRNLTQQASLPMPGLYLIDTPMPNAFATGRNPSHAAVAVTRGIVDLLDSRELSGVIAHELSHVKNRDILISTIAATFAGAVFILARMAQFAAIFGGGRGGRDSRGGVFSLLIVAIVAPLAAMIVRMAISRSREYQADASGAHISGDPPRWPARCGSSNQGFSAAARGEPQHGPPVYRESVEGRFDSRPVFNPPAHGRTDQAPGTHGARAGLITKASPAHGL